MSADLFLSMLAREPMLITLDGAVSFAALMRCDVPKNQQPRRNFFGDTVPEMRIEAGVAYVPVVGPMINKAGYLLKGFGAVAHEDIAANLDQAAADGSVRSIVLTVDSPGGTVNGTPELGDKIAGINASKPVYAFTDGLMASAAYWLSAGTSGIYATKSARIGSIGAALEVTNFSEALKARGINVEVFTSGPMKAAGHPYQPMNDGARKYFQSQVDSIGDTFKAFVGQHRRGIKQSSMDGSVFFAPEAKARGFIDGIVASASAIQTSLRRPTSTTSAKSHRIGGHCFEGHSRATLAARLGISESSLSPILSAKVLTPRGQLGPHSWKFSVEEIETVKQAIQTRTLQL